MTTNFLCPVRVQKWGPQATQKGSKIEGSISIFDHPVHGTHADPHATMRSAFVHEWLATVPATCCTRVGIQKLVEGGCANRSHACTNQHPYVPLHTSTHSRIHALAHSYMWTSVQAPARTSSGSVFARCIPVVIGLREGACLRIAKTQTRHNQ